MSDRKSYRCPNADRREHHDDVRELEHRFGQALAEGQHRPSFSLLHQGERNPEDNTENNNLQDLTFDNGLGDILREYVKNDVCRALRGRRRLGPRGSRR